jgi:acyl-CoA synthetase (AMP-forming)/AMP-acid ligase II
VSDAHDWGWLLRAETFAELVSARAATTPDAILLYDEQGTSVTCREFAERADGIAAALSLRGIGAGTRVAWQLPTRISTVLLLTALRRLDAVQAPIVPLYREREVGVALESSRAQFFFVPDEVHGHDFVSMATKLTAGLSHTVEVVPVGGELPESDASSQIFARPADPDAVRWIYFTSGSTGEPKGARHSDRSLVTSGLAFAGIGGLGRDPDEIAAMPFPFGHVGGVQYLIAALAGGYPILLLESFAPAAAVALFRHYGVTTTGGAPALYQALISLAATRSPGDPPMLPALRTLKGGGAPCPPEIFTAARSLLAATVAHDYGMTEAPMIAVASPDDPPEILERTDGRIVPHNAVRLVDAAGEALPDGVVGEIQVRGAGVCRGYTDEAATSAAFTSDGWLRTGDLGKRTGDHLEVVGRLKDLIIRKGENIAPAEIEGHLAQHPAVADVAVIALPDTERGELVCAVVVLRPGEPAPDVATFATWLSERGLMRQKLPERVEIVDALPRTGLGKVAKTTLRDRFTLGSSHDELRSND